MSKLVSDAHCVGGAKKAGWSFFFCDNKLATLLKCFSGRKTFLRDKKKKLQSKVVTLSVSDFPSRRFYFRAFNCGVSISFLLISRCWLAFLLLSFFRLITQKA